MSDIIIAAVIIGIASAILFDVLFLRWLRRRPNRKFELQPTDRTEPPCWVYGWPDDLP